MQNIDYQNLSDVELTAFLKKGDQQAFTEIYERYWAILLRHARRMLQDDEETRDVLQDVFSTLWNKAPVLEFNTSLSAFLYALVRNKILNLVVRDKVKANYLSSLDQFLGYGESTADHQIRIKQLAGRIEEELALLPPKMREVFELSRKHNLSYSQISEKLMISENTVKKQISNAIRQLRFKLKILFLVIVALYLT
jgi:RNA polymerase sigma-70 factor (ECF subfamily)